MSKVIGIDLGTTNSCVSVVENGAPVIIPTSAGGLNHPKYCSIYKKRRAAGRRGGQTPGSDKPGPAPSVP